MGETEIWELNSDVKKYDKLLENCLNITPYHYSEYLLSEEKAEDYPILIFLYKEENNYAIYPIIKRSIKDISYMKECKDNVYDLITPHEYAGVLSNSEDILIKEKLLCILNDYCRKNNIIYHFVRINPYLNDLKQVYSNSGFKVVHSNEQVCVDLNKSEEDIWNNYKANVRRNIRRGLKEKLIFEMVDKNDENIKIFTNMYYKAMEILEAKKFLYFNDEYFKCLLKFKNCKLAFVKNDEKKVIASSIILLDSNIVYYHLGCFDREFSLQRPMNFLMHNMIIWSKRQGFDIFHIGGGGASLRRFKEGFSGERISYYIAINECIEDKYKYVCEYWENKFPQFKDEKFYPQYRYNEI